MKIILVMVMSANGKITAGENTRVHDWSSKEDQKYFAALKEKSRLIIMGRKTFDVARPTMTLSPKTLRVVLTGKPKSFAKLAVPEQLEFTNESPKVLVKRLKRQGYKEVLIAGGTEINTLFLKKNLVSELWLTIEPVFLGRGKNLLGETPLNTGVRLKSHRQLNGEGTLLLKYEVNRK